MIAMRGIVNAHQCVPSDCFRNDHRALTRFVGTNPGQSRSGVVLWFVCAGDVFFSTQFCIPFRRPERCVSARITSAHDRFHSGQPMPFPDQDPPHRAANDPRQSSRIRGFHPHSMSLQTNTMRRRLRTSISQRVKTSASILIEKHLNGSEFTAAVLFAGSGATTYWAIFHGTICFDGFELCGPTTA